MVCSYDGLLRLNPSHAHSPQPSDKGCLGPLLTRGLADNAPFFDLSCAIPPCHIIKAPRVVGRVTQAVPTLDSLPNGVRGNGVMSMSPIKGGAR